MSEEQKGDEMAEQRRSLMEKFTSKDDHEQPTEVAEASLEEQMLNLRKECIDLADEQRKVERNADSVSGEMFAECQVCTQILLASVKDACLANFALMFFIFVFWEANNLFFF